MEPLGAINLSTEQGTDRLPNLAVTNSRQHALVFVSHSLAMNFVRKHIHLHLVQPIFHFILPPIKIKLYKALLSFHPNGLKCLHDKQPLSSLAI